MLSTEQLSAVESKSSHIVVVAAAGSGKTRTLTERVNYLLKQGVDPSTIFAITYTNMAAQEMSERLTTCPPSLFIGTIHSLANQILVSNSISTSQEINDENFDRLFDLIEENNVVMPRVSHVLVDEFQDITEKEYSFIFNNLKPENYFIVGDSRQAIYGFKGSNFKYFNNLVEGFNVDVYYLTTDYRNTSSIGRFAGKFIKGMSDIITTPIDYRRDELGCVLNRDYSPQDLVKLILENDSFGDWFVLTRTNAESEDVMAQFTHYGIPFDTFKKSEKTYEELKELMSKDTVKVLTIHSAKGLEAKNVAVIGARTSGKTPASVAEEKRICYVAATRARDNLIWYKNKKTNYYYNKRKNDDCKMITF